MTPHVPTWPRFAWSHRTQSSQGPLVVALLAQALKLVAGSYGARVKRPVVGHPGFAPSFSQEV